MQILGIEYHWFLASVILTLEIILNIWHALLNRKLTRKEKRERNLVETRGGIYKGLMKIAEDCSALYGDVHRFLGAAFVFEGLFYVCLGFIYASLTVTGHPTFPERYHDFFLIFTLALVMIIGTLICLILAFKKFRRNKDPLGIRFLLRRMFRQWP